MDLLLQAGFNSSIKYRTSNIVYFASEDDEYARFFSPQFAHVRGGKTLIGLLGSIKFAFLKDLSSYSDIHSAYLVTAFSPNFPELRDPPLFGLSKDEDVTWCKSIFSVANEFPKNVTEYDHMVQEDKLIAGFPIRRMLFG